MNKINKNIIGIKYIGEVEIVQIKQVYDWLKRVDIKIGNKKDYFTFSSESKEGKYLASGMEGEKIMCFIDSWNGLNLIGDYKVDKNTYITDKHLEVYNKYNESDIKLYYSENSEKYIIKE